MRVTAKVVNEAYPLCVPMNAAAIDKVLYNSRQKGCPTGESSSETEITDGRIISYPS